MYEPLLNIYYSLGALRFGGQGVFCPICERSFRAFVNDSKYGTCPKCGGGSRHRVFYLFLKRKTNFFSDRLRVLHFAPEHCFFGRFRRQENLVYISADIHSPRAMETIDMTRIDYANDHFDVIFSNHVLEHVQDDVGAMAELYRVLKKGGWSVHNVPIDLTRTATFEDPQVTSPEQRAKIYGHHDHKRIYGLDYARRLQAAGFTVEAIPVTDFATAAEIEEFRLGERSTIFFCIK
jgi:SAM-dependent methyltransferase